ncbi:pilus assembly PilX family protein [Solilutibacter tolerans]|uniref:Type IV pilus assembly protein PilX n=1 Tax=Solilutibacter tolerans TaxID=1604334 RepID=A0A1N6NS85_9GAMM|nr:PilX N-terminal domain-containing pilus assembly protein [Lysobacter tolerans]SIP94910.1 type IV pilus assembly protein PilX [Lysobacter tolerans]
MKHRSPYPTRNRQSGAALAVVLILLIVVTLIGLASLRGTLLQERMSASAFDRSVAFQQAESALRAGEAVVRQNWQANNPKSAAHVNCEAVGTVCDVVPPNTYSGGGAGWTSVTASTKSTVAGTPQYYIEYMGESTTGDTSYLGYGDSANAAQYGSEGGQTNGYFFRITARSADPAAVSDRALVVLQTRVSIK